MHVSNKMKKYVFMILSSMLLLSGCINNETPEQQMYEVLEKVVTLEKPFVEQQETLVELEKQEKELYDKIMELGMKQHDEIIVLSDEAISLNEQRKERMEKERNSMIASEKEFITIQPIVEKIEETSLKKEAEQLYHTMLARYKSHESLYTYYMEGLRLDSELYTMFKNKELSLEEIEKQILKINDRYEKVLEENKTFNEQTEKFNQIKLAFYHEAGFEVKEQK